MYDAVVHWKGNLFTPPLGCTGKSLVEELTRIIVSFGEEEHRSETWYKVAVACQLLLQKPNGSTSASEHSDALTRRLELWSAGRINDLFLEACCIQDHLLPSKFRKLAETATSDTDFAKLVYGGKFRAAMHVLSTGRSAGLLKLDDVADPRAGTTVRDVLLEKHPQSTEPPADTILDAEVQQPQPIIFAAITGKLIKQVSREISGSAGPSGLDADGWRRLLACYGGASERLCSALAAATRKWRVGSTDSCTPDSPRQAAGGQTHSRWGSLSTYYGEGSHESGRTGCTFIHCAPTAMRRHSVCLRNRCRFVPFWAKCSATLTKTRSVCLLPAAVR